MNKELEQFFTKESVSNLIASNILDINPKIVVDVGAGEGSLLAAVNARWKKARLVGVDIDPTLAKNNSISRIERIIADGLDHSLPEYLKNNYGKIDLAVSNPPYTSIQGSRNTELILKDAGLFESIGSSKNYPAELVFLAQNLRILNKGGRLAIIIPSGIVNSDRWEKLRRLLCSNNQLEMVIELPDNVFEKTEAKTFVIFLKKSGSTKKIKLYKATPQGKLLHPKTITADQATHRMDWTYYNFQSQFEKKLIPSFSLRELEAHIFRGQLSGSDALRLGIKLFHSSSMSDDPKEISIKNYDVMPGNQHIIKPGDILIARVGSRCIGRVAFVKSGTAIVSDSVFVIRLDKKYQGYVWGLLKSTKTREQVLAIARGVCAKYITKDQILDLLLY
jgi:tRNA1(Val) A37 N6-methylase TrmN6